MKTVKRCGFVAILGRPNVGKSSLLNAMLRKKISIISYKPQTTRDQILGIKTQDDTQIIFVDTPGMHLGGKRALNKQMNKIARQSMSDVNAIIFVVEALKWTAEDDMVCQRIQKQDSPIIIAVNKIDLVPNKTDLLAFSEHLAKQLPTATIVPVSATKKIQLDQLEKLAKSHLPESPFYFAEDQSTDKPEFFQVSEIIREKLFLFLQKELPYSLCVQIETMDYEPNINHIHAMIWVERESQKGIIVGEKGSKLKEIGTAARLDLERFFDKKVCLKLWVKVQDAWSDDVRMLQNIGIMEN